jgi:hypothetical protein
MMMSDFRLQTIEYAHGAGFLKGIEFAERWIPVEEESPTQNKVLVKTIEGHVFTAEYLDGKFTTFYLGTEFQITHWRYISNL